ncbi:DUF5367 family protein [Owenweeksia hongkongensis]|uniref:DUF5367 family protein n=1 Tax=Owenweeksia hongkongensis TaxID=253245 RepID=UPI003A8D942B
MKSLNLKHVAISAATVYAIGILAFVGSYFVPLLDDADFQANLVLMIAIIPAAYLGAHLYYRKAHGTNGFLLGGSMFLGAMILDALITVPLFIIPNGGNYVSFFGDPGFWLIGVEYIGVVVAYWQFRVVDRQVRHLL